MRRSSVSLPTRDVAHDPHEKAARYKSQGSGRGGVGILESVKAAWMMTQSQRSRYLKTGGILLFVLFLIYYLSPGGANVHRELDNLGSSSGQSSLDSTTGTTRCKQSSDKSKPIVQYAIMIDAGSTGSRVHVYRFNNCGPTPELENELFKMTPKKDGGAGLSSYKSDAEGAAKSLDILMDAAVAEVPENIRSCTPVAVKATAGLRLLGTEMSQKILDAVRERLENNYPFPVVSKEENGVAIMDGADEGVFAWITTNYLLGNIGGPDHTDTAAVFDLGGGSTQIVFEPTFKALNHGKAEKLADGDHKYELKFGGRDFELYQHSHLNFGLMEARKSIHRTLINDIYSLNPSDTSWLQNPVPNPCISSGMSQSIDVELPSGHALGEKVTVNMTGLSAPAAAQCRKLAETILVKDAACVLAPCSFNGIHQPSLEKTFARQDIYAFSYFFDRTDPLGMPESFSLQELHQLTSQVCGGESHWDVFEGVPGAIAELKDRPQHCLDLNYMMALLHTGYDMPIDREVKIAKKIKGNELGWCLGASLPLLSHGSGWTCRIKEVA